MFNSFQEYSDFSFETNVLLTSKLFHMEGGKRGGTNSVKTANRIEITQIYKYRKLLGSVD